MKLKRQASVSFLAGLIFGLGLVISGMTKPENIINFLDLFGNWDPRLLLVMVGATGVHFITYRLILKREAPLLATKFQVPTRRDIDWRLISGSAVFGVGWGLGGFCPGPGITALSSGLQGPMVFVVAMLAGMILFRVFSSLRVAKPAVTRS